MNTGLIAIFILLIIIVGAIATRRCVEFLIGGSLLAAIFMYGKDFLPQWCTLIQDVLAAGADVYVTGDIDHHTGIDTVAQGLAIIDAGHYGTEYIFMEDMKERLAKAFPELTVSCAKMRSPYTIL